MAIIYKITNNMTGKIYVGKTIHDPQTRLNEHISNGRKIHGSSLIAKSLREYGSLNHSIEVLEICSECDNLLEREQHWIDALNTVYTGYNIKNEHSKNKSNNYWGNEKQAINNIAKGLAWNKGISPSKETRMKISATKIKKKELGFYKNSYGHKHSEETKHKLSEIAKSRPVPNEETRNKLRKASLSRKCYYNPEIKNRIYIKDYDKAPEGYIKGKGTCWVNKKGIIKSINLWDLDDYLKNGYKKGRV